MKRSFLRLLRKIGVLKKLNLNLKKNINNHEFIIPVIGEVGFNNYLNLSEQWMLDLADLVLSEMDDNKTFVDVGLNTGQTLLKIKSIKPSIHYIGFEPNPNCLNYLSKLTELNNFKNTVIYPVGISNNTELLRLNLFQDEITDSSASIVSDFRDKSTIKKQLIVPIFELKKVEEFKQKIGILKIDVEGGELEVLQQFEPILTQQETIIFIEILPIYEKTNQFRIDRQNEILRIIKNLDYLLYLVVKTEFTLFGVKLIEEIGVHGDLNKCDYVLVPKKKKSQFESPFLITGKLLTE